MGTGREALSYVATAPQNLDSPSIARSLDLASHSIEHTVLLHIADAGILPGGGPLSPFCQIVKPTVHAARITVAATDGDSAP